MPAGRLSRRAFLTRPAPARTGDVLVRLHRRIMACRVEVVLPGEAAGAMSCCGAALNEAERLEEVMTIFRETSELSRINREAHLTPVPVSDDLFAVLSQAESVSRATGGAFDITSTPLSNCWGFLRRRGLLPSAGQIEEARQSVGMDLVALDAVDRTVSFRRPGVALNLGAIGKGFALDRMAAVLKAEGISEALLSAGYSSILALGGHASPWPVDLRTATDGGLLARLRLTDAAVGTSGAGEQFFELNGVRYGHVIDPRTGWPASGVLSASVIASSAARADALSTAFLIGGLGLAREYCASHADVLAIVTPADGVRRPVIVGSHPGARVERR